MRSLLVCGAHPDDETFFAGTMAKYASEGARVSILCGTRGERGSTADLCSIPELPTLREAELRASMRVLGLRDDHVFFLPYEDQKLHLAPSDQVREQIVHVFRQVQPQVVVTFDPHGANGHTDHVAMSRFVLDALPAASDARCCPDGYAPWTVSRLLWQPPVFSWRVPTDRPVTGSFGNDFIIDTSQYAEVKRAAILEHKTQLPGLEHLFLLNSNPGATLDEEIFRLGWGSRPFPTPCGDLFEGLADLGL